MPRPKLGYFLKDGTKVPGVTDITGRFMDKGGLMHWAFQQGKKGMKSLYEKRDEAGEIGTIVHGMAELALKGRCHDEIQAYAQTAMPDLAMRRRAQSLFDQFDDWRGTYRVTPYKQETSLVSERHQYGGTNDLTLSVGNELAMLDIKTSPAVYPDNLIQLAGYKGLWDENFSDTPVRGGFHLLLIPKDGSGLKHYYYPQLRKAWSQFMLYRQAYALDAELKDPRLLGGIPVHERSTRQIRRAVFAEAVGASVH
jgi:hypothetical protein